MCGAVVCKFWEGDVLYWGFCFPLRVWSLALGFQGGKLRQVMAVSLSLLALVPGVLGKLGIIRGDIWK